MTPSGFFARGFAERLETITVKSPGFVAGVDADGNPVRVAAEDVVVADVDIQPTSGASRLLPEAVRNEATYQAFVDLANDAAVKRAAVVAGRVIERATGQQLTITWVGDWETHLVVALATTGGVA